MIQIQFERHLKVCLNLTIKTLSNKNSDGFDGLVTVGKRKILIFTIETLKGTNIDGCVCFDFADRSSREL